MLGYKTKSRDLTFKVARPPPEHAQIKMPRIQCQCSFTQVQMQPKGTMLVWDKR